MTSDPSYAKLDRIGRIRLSKNFYMRDFLYSEVAACYGITNIPDNEDLAVEVGQRLCEELLEPLQRNFGRLHIRSAYRSCRVNEIGNLNGHNCASNESNFAGHIWDRLDGERRKGATACVVIPAFVDRFNEPGDWTELAWWIHDHLPYCSLWFFPKNWAFNITWSNMPCREIASYAPWFLDGKLTKKQIVTRLGMENNGLGNGTKYARLMDAFSL